LPDRDAGETSGQLRSQALRANGPLLILGLVYFAFSATMARALGFAIKPMGSALFLWSGAIFLGFILIVGVAIFRLARNKPERPISFLIQEAKESQIAKRAAYGVPILALIPVFSASFTALKMSIARIVPFYADPWLSHLDRFLHGGVDPWRILQPILADPLTTFAIDYCYRIWFPTVFIALIYGAFMVRDDRLRLQFLLTYFLCWIVLGNLLAVALSSVGPCYYEAFGGDGRYRDLLAYLRQVNEHEFGLFAVQIQSSLLHLYRAGDFRIGSGISAMPSMHVAVALVVAIFARRIHPILGMAALGFVIVIVIGSVHLGWHYAVDGYASLLLVPLIWMTSGRIVDRLFPRAVSTGSSRTHIHRE
jgi:hypothetical protein